MTSSQFTRSVNGAEGTSRNILRFLAFGLVIALVMATLGASMFWMQVLDNHHFQALANDQISTIQSIPSNRGLIYDSQGRLLVRNVVSYSVKIVPAELPLSQRAVVVNRLAGLLNLDPVDVITKLDSTTALLDPVRVARDVPPDVARVIEEDPDALPGVKVVAEARREYEYGTLLGQILGYTGPVDPEEYAALKSTGYQPDDMIGKTGLESVYESQLRGQYGQQKVERDASGIPIPGMVTPISPEEPGDSLRLTIDVHEQELATKALEWGLHGLKVSQGVIIVMNPQTGEILAMVSLPGYDDNLFARGISNQDFQKLATDPNKPLVNKAISEQKAPGSTFKLVTGTAALQAKIITDHTAVMTHPYISLGGWKFWDWNHAGFGPQNIYQGFAHSSDTFFYQLAQWVGLDRLTGMAFQYGFGAPTGIDLPGEVPGIVPTEAWKMATTGEPVYGGDLLYAGIGQGYDAVTPLQLLNAYCALANGGKLLQPQVVKEIVGPDGNVVQAYKPKLIHQMNVSAKNLETMRLAARNVVVSRHTYNLVELPVKVAGKTGTAEYGLPDKYGRLPYDEWFVGFTPGDPYKGDFAKPDSQLAVVAYIHGANSWGDVSTEVVKYYLAMHYNLPGNMFSDRTPGHIQKWATIRTNFAGTDIAR